ncbi:lactonase family protein [Indibacter alkaliphilus]|nr:lactonase family protein [Indibacter alkaliphilus]
MIKNRGLFLTLLISTLIYFACDYEPEEEMIEPAYTFLLGAYTDSEDQGVGLLQFDPEYQILTSKVISEGIKNPSFVISNKAQNLVFAVEETSGENGGKVKSFEFDRDNASLKLLDTQDTYGDHPCYMSLDPSEKFLVVGNYSGGNFSVYNLENGKMKHIQTIAHEGQSINPSRQEKAHVHSAVFHPNGKQLLVADLGTDKIHLYDFNPNYAVPFQHAEKPYLEVDAGSGPRHLAIHPNGKMVYLIHELSADVGVYSYENGQMAKVQVLGLTDPDFFGTVGAAEIRISPDGKFLYASNRGDANSISVFEIEKDGKIRLQERVDSGGVMPRNFIITGDGKYLLAAHQESSDIFVFERDQRSGKLKQTSLSTSSHKPVYFFGLN